jgi:hypothetical protein
MSAEQHQIDKCLAETYKHIKRVGHYLHTFSKELIDRAEHHDDSKLEEPELSGFAENTEKLAKVEYGSEEYRNMLAELKPTIEHHYSKNRHHTEFWPNGINDMNLIDLLEMLSDWRAAGERRGDAWAIPGKKSAPKVPRVERRCLTTGGRRLRVVTGRSGA